MTPEAEAVRDAYRLRRQMYQPRWNGSNPRWFDCWQKTADFVSRNSLDLGDYLDAQFRLKAPFPMPNQLYSEAALSRYNTHAKTRVDPQEELLRRVEVELNFLSTRLDVGFSLEEVLAFPSSPLTPLFCYSAARAFGRPDLAAVFEEAAARQRARLPAAEAIYLQVLPEDSHGSGGL